MDWITLMAAFLGELRTAASRGSPGNIHGPQQAAGGRHNARSGDARRRRNLASAAYDYSMVLRGGSGGLIDQTRRKLDALAAPQAG
jgi:fructose-1,6-bisphosphatase/inositol monophosphatase family enzyme